MSANTTQAEAALQQHCTREALRIWRVYAHQHPHAPGMALMPLLLDDYHIGVDILFVGMNPSFSQGAVRRIWANAENGIVEGVNPFEWDAELDDDTLTRRVQDILRFEKTARAEYAPYFRPLQDFAGEAGARSHGHIDMFVVRHTTQADVHAAYGKRFAELVPIAKEQFQLFRHTLKAMAPKTVVIVNAGASHLAREGLGLKTEDRGRTYFWEELPGTQFFLSGMLSGQRALDVFSRARLTADVRQVLVRT